MSERRPDFQTVFPIRADVEEKLTRKQFLVAFFSSVVALLAVRLTYKKWWPEKSTTGRFKIPLKASQLSVGTSFQFQNPHGKEPLLVTRLSDEKIVSFCQKCTHLSCPVHYLHDKQQFLCPCHEGVFDAETGRPLSGPPREALKRYEVQVIKDEIYVSLA